MLFWDSWFWSWDFELLILSVLLVILRVLSKGWFSEKFKCFYWLYPKMLGRFLSEVLVETHGGQSLVGSIKIAVLPIAKVFTMCFMGFLMASKYVNILPASGRKLLNGVIMLFKFISLLAFFVGFACYDNNQLFYLYTYMLLIICTVF